MRVRRSWAWAAVAVIALAMGAGLSLTDAQAEKAEQAEKPAKAVAGSKFIGSAKCKNCHSSAATGDQYGKWKAEKHSKAMETLATPDGKKVAAAKGVAGDPQKAEQCVKCHSTAAGEAEDRFAKGFDHNAGVQCETCHGPGEKHMKARMAAAAAAPDTADDAAVPAHVEVPKDEILAAPEMTLCVTCHNKESPSYKPFCFKKFSEKIAHLDPRVKRPTDYFTTLKCDCDDCKKLKGGQ